MIMLNRFALGMWFAMAVALRAADVPDVTPENYGGWPNCLVMRGGDCKAVIVPLIGARVLNYSLNGENILFDNPDANGRTLLNSSNFWAGGYQLDLGPELRGIPNHKWLWQGPWGWRVPRPHTVHTYSEADKNLGVQLEKEFVMDPDTGELGVMQQWRNVSTNDVSFCLWDRTLCKPGGFAMFPLNPKSRFKAGWSIRRGQRVPEFRYDGESPADPRVRVINGVLVAQAKGLPEARELKIGADSQAGWIAYALGRVMFVKFFPVYPGGNYTDGGNTVEFYCSDRVGELEPLSPEVKLKPTEVYSFPEKWMLIELPREVTTYEQARAATRLIPKSPFGR